MATTLELETPIAFDRFGWDAVEAQARAERLGVAELVAQACTYYASELVRDRAATTPPRFAATRGEREPRTLTIELEAGVLQRLEREAERQGLVLERLLEHAVLLYLADADAGLVAERIARRANRA